MSGRWGLFAYEALDYKAAQAWLDGKGAAGWRLKKLYLGGLARFERDETGVVRYCVAPTPAGLGGHDDYYRLCADAGWDRAARFGGMDLFLSQPGVFPVPLQTDPRLEWEAIARRMRRGWLWGVLTLALLAALCAASGGPRASAYLITNAELLTGLSMAAVLAFHFGVAGALDLHRCLRCRRAAEAGRSPPAARQGAARTRYLLGMALWLLLCVTGSANLLSMGLTAHTTGVTDRAAFRRGPVVLSEDLDLPRDGPGSVYTAAGASVLVEWRCSGEYLRLDGESAGVVVCDVYRCANGAAARLLAALLRGEEARGLPSHVAGYHEAVPLAPAALGFDQSWSARAGGTDYLLLRQGATVAVVEANTDLTAPEALEALRTRLRLEEAGT